MKDEAIMQYVQDLMMFIKEGANEDDCYLCVMDIFGSGYEQGVADTTKEIRDGLGIK